MDLSDDCTSSVNILKTIEWCTKKNPCLMLTFLQQSQAENKIISKIYSTLDAGQFYRRGWEVWGEL